MSGRPELGPRLLTAALAVAALGIAWSELFVGPEAARIGALCLVASLPALAASVRRRRRITVPAAALLAAILGVAIVLSISPLSLVADPAEWRTVAAMVPDGLQAASSNDLPIAATDEPALAGLLELALLVLAAAAAWQAGARGTPIGAVVALGAGLAYRWTVLPPDQPVVAGAIGLAVVIAIVALLGASRTHAVIPRVAGASALGALALAIGVLGAGPARSEGAWLDWTSWEVAGGEDSRTASLDLEQRYGQLNWPETPRVVLRVTSPRRLHLKAASLESFDDGIAFGLGRTGPAEELSVENDRIVLGDPAAAGETHSQEVRLASARSNLLLAPGRPLGFSGDVGDFAERLGESVRVEPGLEPDSRYMVTSAIPDERPSTLLAAPTPASSEVADRLTQVRAGPGGHVVDVPMWGGGAPLPSPAEFGLYEPVVQLAREVAGDADSQYEAVNLIEAHVRSEYAYDEQPPRPVSGAVPITDFVGRTQRGFCQHFAGTMGVMLRGLGIPARVAVGYTGGRFDPGPGEWTVIDRDAHSWVEVYFSGHGWIPFDPTPGRAVASPASVSSPDYAPIEAAVADGVVEDAVDPASRAEEVAADRATEPIDDEIGAGGPGSGGDSSGGRSGLLALSAGGIAGLVLLLALGPAIRRWVRRERGRRLGTPRDRVLAAARDLERALARSGVDVPESSTPAERARIVRRASGTPVDQLYDLVARAKYGPPRGEHVDPRLAWREADDARRALRARRIRRRRRHRGGSPIGEGTLQQ